MGVGSWGDRWAPAPSEMSTWPVPATPSIRTRKGYSHLLPFIFILAKEILPYARYRADIELEEFPAKLQFDIWQNTSPFT